MEEQYLKNIFDDNPDHNNREEQEKEQEEKEQEEKEQEEKEQEEEEQEEEEQEQEQEPIKIPEIDYSKMFKEIKILNNIKTYITYINSDNEIEMIHQKKLFLNNEDNIVSRNKLIEVIKNSQKKHNVKYKLISIMVYNIHVTPESLPSYIENPNEFISLYTLNRIESFELKPTLRLLKKYNGIYFFFFECPADESQHQPKPQSSMQAHNRFIKNNNTKRIHIHSLNKHKQKQQHKKTKRYDRYVNLL